MRKLILIALLLAGIAIPATAQNKAFVRLRIPSGTFTGIPDVYSFEVYDEGTRVYQTYTVPRINCTGTGISCSYNSTTGRLDVTVSGGGSPAFSSITSGTNTTAAMIVGTGASLSATGTGTNNATDTTKINNRTVTISTPVAKDFLCDNGSALVNCYPGLPSRADANASTSITSADLGFVVNFTHATASAVSIAEAGVTAANGFRDAFWVIPCAKGTGTVTITPTTSTINVGGQALTTLVLLPGDCARLYVPTEDDTDYAAIIFHNFISFTVHQWGTGASNIIQDTDDWANIMAANYPFIITEICGRTDTGTSTFNIQRNDGSAASIAASNIVADTTSPKGVCTSTFTSGENIISIGHVLDFLQVAGAPSGSPTHIMVTISGVRK